MGIELTELKNSLLRIFKIDSINKLGAEILKNLNNNSIYEDIEEAVNGNFKTDFLQIIYQYYLADRKERKQDYTPTCLAHFLSLLIGSSDETIDLCAGTGALTIQRWVDNPNMNFILYEIDDTVIPYLLLNLSIRNISATVIQGDVLSGDINKKWNIRRGEKYATIIDL